MSIQPKHSASGVNKPLFIVLVIVFLLALLLAYSNHFQNSFHFDDFHTIKNNTAIKEFNLVRYFTETETFSTLAANQVYRPFTTLQNAIDYKLAGGLNTKVFHIHIFMTYITVCVLFFFFTRKLLSKFYPLKNNTFLPLLLAAIFGILIPNAETVNYIIQRAEILAALFILAGFVAYQSGGIWRKWHLYLIFPVFGFLSKEMGLVFAPLLFLYCLLFEEKTYLLEFYKKKEFKKIKVSFVKSIPAFIISIGFYLFYQSMVPESFTPGGTSLYKYIITQPMVICHYALTYLVPYQLSPDTDWQPYNSILDYRSIIGIIILLCLVFIALKATKKDETRLISFGLLWFLIALLPTSSLIPLAEVMNDHRTFIPYLGLTIAFVFGIEFLIKKYLKKTSNSKSLKLILYSVIILFFAGSVYGVRERNKIWKNELTLWKHVTEKSPKNARGLMNYGVALMSKGNYQEAEAYFNKALKLTPNYSLIFVNLGTIKNATNRKADAESDFKKAIDLTPNLYTTTYAYGNFLMTNKRYKEAKQYLEKTYALAPNYEAGHKLLFSLYHKNEDWNAMGKLAQEILGVYPTNALGIKYQDIAQSKKSELEYLEETIALGPSPAGYLNLSLEYFQINQYDKTIEAAKKAIELKSDYAEAYNNIGIANFKLGNYKDAITAYHKALEIKPNYNLAQNNLEKVTLAKNNEIALLKELEGLKTADNLLNFSLKCYNQGAYRLAITAAKTSNSIKESTYAYNNICASLNKLEEFDKAIEACNKALKIDESNRYAQGNLNFAILQNSK